MTSLSKSRKSSSERKEIKQESDLKLANLTCPVCLSILIEPVTLPCSHELCMPCFKQYVAETSLLCPVCRRRLSTWVRRATKNGTLVNARKWTRIQQSHPYIVNRRLNGDDTDAEEDADALVSFRKLSRPGEIRKEYEEQMQRVQDEFRQQRELEVLRSEKYIQELQAREEEEETKRKLEAEKLAQDDHKLAVSISQLEESTSCNRENAAPSTSTGHETSRDSSNSQLKSASIEAISEHRLRSGNTDSDDSISPELCHFRPIKSAPRTPPQPILRDGQENDTEQLGSRSRLTVNLSSSRESRVIDMPAFQKRLNSIDEDRKARRPYNLSQTNENEEDIPSDNSPSHIGFLSCKKSPQKRKPLSLALSSANCTLSHREQTDDSLGFSGARLTRMKLSQVSRSASQNKMGTKKTRPENTRKARDKNDRYASTKRQKDPRFKWSDVTLVQSIDLGSVSSLNLECAKCGSGNESDRRSKQEEEDYLLALRLYAEDERTFSNIKNGHRSKYNLRDRKPKT